MTKVFDLDGTLLDSNGIWREVDQRFVDRHGCRLTEEYNEFVAHAIFPVAARFTKEYYHLADSEEEIMSAWRELARDAYARELPLKPGAEAYLAQCADNGERLVLYTSSEPSLCRAALKRHGILAYFEQLYFAQELELEKKHPASFRALSALLNEPAQGCILFDDSPVACTSAKEAGWKVVGIFDPFFEHQRVQMEQICDWFVTGFGELIDRPERAPQ